VTAADRTDPEAIKLFPTRQNDHRGTMIRHAGLGPPQPIAALAHPMQSSASVRPLVTSIGGAKLLAPGSQSAHWAAVALPAIATAADAENDATGTTVTVSERNLGHGHPLVPMFQSRYTLHQMTDDARLRRG
jgi:hypothetical protein